MTADPRRDQLRAAVDHAHQAVSNAAAQLPSEDVQSFGELRMSSLHRSPIHDAVRRWMFQPSRHCGHLGIQPGFGILREPGRAYCAGCLPAALTSYAAKNADLCDTCGNRSVLFHEMTFQIGPAILIGNACPACLRAYEKEANRADA